ncbi:oligopeptidase A [Methylotuvimicrobium alcaliphilum]|uniref:oligopeptidase A n=1 Tax=Methylotuvimicrobium alcaliphilum (strain DSM 19304 / NCIMB 14124 / VKM B-2133 / 20Z) TaxID=1091494 RepID=G4T3M0_META2|nr:oligopeptidase A [Methylotuvimicrobium alcaliphilum]CCE23734.1 oligopeptidase A [Methylotuvimicrobium alcaliphilum 20Z]
MNNPLLTDNTLPHFSEIKPEHVVPAIEKLLADARATVDRHLKATDQYSWENLIEPIENTEDKLNKAWSPVSHMNSVVNSEPLREAYNACLPLLSDYSTEMGQNEALFKAYQAIAQSDEFQSHDKAQKKIVANALRDFKLSGIDLEPAKKQRYKEISQELSRLTSRFEENLMDATNAWSKLITDSDDLAGLPKSALAQAKQTAEANQQSGWMITLQFPSFQAVMTYADSRALRREHYEAFVTRASDLGPHAGRWDNSQVMEQILSLRHEQARLLGYDNYAELSLTTKMADNPDQVIGFLEDLADKSWRQARKDLYELREFASKHYGIKDLQPWDIGYYSEKMRQHFYQLSQEEVKTYFPIDRVLPGLFAIVEKLYGLDISEIDNFDSWHEDVRFYQILDRDGQLRGQFYTDLYARPKKRGGAWMDVCVSRKKYQGEVQTPVAYLTCNFTPPTGDDPALLTHDEVTTLFHEFGHGLHHMLTQVDHLGVSGINGVEWDAVELPSQFMENWCWEKDALELISGHYQTGDKLPDSLFDKMLAAKNFQSGMMMVRQLEFSLFDLIIHKEYDPAKGGRIYEILEQVRKQVAVVTPPSFNRFAHSFSHIFAGGYAAGYYSYKWAEVLSSDAFSMFEEHGIFNETIGHAFLTNILEQGGSDDAMELFIQFRGREPEIDALLRHNGII